MPSLDLKKPKSNRKLVGLVFVITGILSVVFWWQGRRNEPLLQPLNVSYSLNQKKITPTRDTTRSTSAFVSSLADELSGSQGDYGLYVYRLGENRGYGINEDQVYPAASIMKVPIMVAAFKAAEEEKITLDEATLELLRAMGKRSDNEAPTAIIQKVGRGYIEEVMSDLGMTKSNLAENTTTSNDVASIWQKLHTGDYLSDEHRDQLWGFLTDSIFEERIPAGVPEGIRVVHKVGTDLDIWADAGIVYAPDPFIVVVLNDSVNLEQAKDLVPKIVRKIWDFETSLSN